MDWFDCWFLICITAIATYALVRKPQITIDSAIEALESEPLREVPCPQPKDGIANLKAFANGKIGIGYALTTHTAPGKEILEIIVFKVLNFRGYCRIVFNNDEVISLEKDSRQLSLTSFGQEEAIKAHKLLEAIRRASKAR